MGKLRAIITGVLAILAVTAALSAEAVARPSASATWPEALTGAYDGSQPEIAAALELGRDGRFRYRLAYGALDEQAQGRWEYDGAEVRLTSDRMEQPRFRLRRIDPLGEARLHIDLELPRGMSHQYFEARIAMADGSVVERQASAEGIDLAIGPLDRPVSVTMALPVYGYRSNPVPLPAGKGAVLRFRFDPNGLGRVAFSHAPLRMDHGDLLLERHGRVIRFRRSPAGN